eukprot:1718858-Amphidinium_carterae.1
MLIPGCLFVVIVMFWFQWYRAKVRQPLVESKVTALLSTRVTCYKTKHDYVCCQVLDTKTLDNGRVTEPTPQLKADTLVCGLTTSLRNTNPSKAEWQWMTSWPCVSRNKDY